MLPYCLQTYENNASVGFPLKQESESDLISVAKIRLSSPNQVIGKSHNLRFINIE
jgi:hypothetical protein